MQAAWRTWRLIRSCDVIALHSLWLAECTYVASHLARFAGIPHIASILGQDALAANPYLKHLALDRMIITACSAKAAEIFFDSTGRRVDHIVPIGLDEEAIATPDQAAERFIDILGVGSLTQVKNFGLFLEVVSGLRSVFPELRCMIIGDGPERPALEAFIQQNRLQSSVQLTGYLPRQTVLQMMRKGRILLHTAHYEGQGYVFLEALASGMYVVCRDVGYTGNGEHVHRCNSTEEMNDMLKTLLASTLDHREVDVIRVERTASAFEKIYGIA
jgi:glycosyltransferase involved in cell wall biosynthesis